jgi:hypothetical protein
VSPAKAHGVAKPPYMLPRYTSLTDEQRSKVEDNVGAIQSEIPVYVTVMKNSNVNSRMCYLVSHHFSPVQCYIQVKNKIKLPFHFLKVYYSC